LQFDGQYVLKVFVTAQSGGGGNTFRCCTEWPTSKNMDFFSCMRRQAVGAIVHLSIQGLLFVGQSSLRSDSRSTAKSITTSALSHVCANWFFLGDKPQVHRCPCNKDNEFLAIVYAVSGGERGSDFYARSDRLSAAKAGTLLVLAKPLR